MHQPVPFEIVLQYASIRNIQTTTAGVGWVGTRFVAHAWGDNSGPLESMQEVREWIIKTQGTIIANCLCHYHPELVESFEAERLTLLQR